jgi:plasmid maintenance system antidote protein VapI
MAKNNNPHPGYVLSGTLRQKGISVKEFARTIGANESFLASVLRGQRDIDEPLSLVICTGLGESNPLRWLEIQESHDKGTKD